MFFESLNNDNFILYAAKAYEKPNCIKSEFKEDLKRLNYIKKLFRRYLKNNDLKERLILNHLVVIYNVFGIEASTRMLFYHIDVECYSALKTFLIFLNYMPNIVKGINDKNIISSDIPVDMNIASMLRRLNENAERN
jgi:hypothetical protein